MPHRASFNSLCDKDIKVKFKCNLRAQKGHKMSGVNKVISILMKRDDMTLEEAKDLVNGVREEIEEAMIDEDYEYIEDIMLYDLGLEMDYVFDILGYMA